MTQTPMGPPAPRYTAEEFAAEKVNKELQKLRIAPAIQRRVTELYEERDGKPSLDTELNEGRRGDFFKTREDTIQDILMPDGVYNQTHIQNIVDDYNPIKKEFIETLNWGHRNIGGVNDDDLVKAISASTVSA